MELSLSLNFQSLKFLFLWIIHSVERSLPKKENKHRGIVVTEITVHFILCYWSIVRLNIIIQA